MKLRGAVRMGSSCKRMLRRWGGGAGDDRDPLVFAYVDTAEALTGNLKSRFYFWSMLGRFSAKVGHGTVFNGSGSENDP